MRLDFVEIAGFRSFRDKLRINFGAGFTVLTGRNGVGKSTIIDAIDFALTGSINKFKVQSAKGGGLAEHIWWVGEGQPSEHFVRLGVVDESGKRYTSTRFKDGSLKEDAPFADLLISASAGQPITLNKLAATTILRDELISELSLDLTERERFAAVLESISPITGPDLSDKVRDVTSLASGRVAAAQEQLVALQARLAQVLEELAEARNKASQAVGTDAALTLLRESIPTLSDDQVQSPIVVDVLNWVIKDECAQSCPVAR
jgi:energy-coupling factor transporter ATP-binding protein EcfA2